MRRTIRILLLLVALALIWQLLSLTFPEREKATRTQVRESVQALFPTLAQTSQSRYGMRRLTDSEPGLSEIVLVHGLDDPGMVWMNLAPELDEAGYGVTVFNYPNDQPIEASAQLLHQQLTVLFAQGVESIDLVAHSMGGLVAREMLTSSYLDCALTTCPQPSVRSLIMIGTPNHGSELARLRGLAEVREQLARLLNKEVHWLDWIFDGAGEAGVDLTPGSLFLQSLNARPKPPETDYWVIAGVIAESQLEALQQLIDEHWVIDDKPNIIDNGFYLGDGLVQLESARLSGVPLLRVEGTHLSIIRNLTDESQRVPPAVPLIVQLLDEQNAGER